MPLFTVTGLVLVAAGLAILALAPARGAATLLLALTVTGAGLVMATAGA